METVSTERGERITEMKADTIQSVEKPTGPSGQGFLMFHCDHCDSYVWYSLNGRLAAFINCCKCGDLTPVSVARPVCMLDEQAA